MAQGQELRFETVYRRGQWKSGGALSGNGSRIDTTEDLRIWLEARIEDGDIKSILDLGCGDLTWISEIEAIRENQASYYGVDIVPALIAHNRRTFLWFRGEACDLEAFTRVRADLVMIKDVLPHLCNGMAGQILVMAEKGDWKYLVVTSHPEAKNYQRHSFNGPAWVPYNVEQARLLNGSIVRRIKRPDGGEYQIWMRNTPEHIQSPDGGSHSQEAARNP